MKASITDRNMLSTAVVPERQRARLPAKAARIFRPNRVLEQIVEQRTTFRFRPSFESDRLHGVAAAGTSIACNNAYFPAELVVILGPDHAHIIQSRGWTRSDVQNYLFEKTRNRREALEGRGIEPTWPDWFSTLTETPVVEKPEDILVVVAGGPGPQSLVAVPWGLSRASTVVIAEA